MKNLIAAILVFALAGQSLWAKAPEQKHVEKIKSQATKYLDSGNHVSIETNDNRQLGGTSRKSTRRALCSQTLPALRR